MAARRTRNQAFSLFAFQDIITSVTGIIVLILLLLTLELIQLEQLSTTLNPTASAEPLLKAIESLEQEIDSANRDLQRGNAEVSELATLTAHDARRQKSTLVQEIARLTAEIQRRQHQQQENLLQAEVLEVALTASSDSLSEIESLEEHIEALRDQLEALEDKNRIIYNPNAKSKRRAWLVDISLDRIQVAELGKVAPPVVFDQGWQPLRTGALQAWARTRNPRTEYFILLVRPKAVAVYKNVREELEKLHFDLGFDVIGDDAMVIDPTTGAGVVQ
jgi:hypothetical protein